MNESRRDGVDPASVGRRPVLALLGFAPLSAGALPAAAQERIERLIARMSLQEKAGQLTASAHASVGSIGNPLAHQQGEREQLDAIRAGQIGALFNGAGVARKRAAQQAAIDGSRLGIPVLFGADILHGFRTVFPVPLAEAASWDPELARRCARAAAIEAAADGFRWTFAPMVDIARDARWGRGVEGAGEDVLLGCLFAAARVRGFQGDDLAAPDALLATPKHFAGYGAAEGGLDYAGADLSPRTLHEVYLPPFRAAIAAGAAAVMSGFHEIAGVPVTADPALLEGVLRQRWAFDGFVISDYTADEELIAHGVAADGRSAAKASFLAGVDMSMQSGLYLAHLPQLVADGEIPLARLDASVRRVLRVKERLGLFDAPMRGLDDDGASRSGSAPEHLELAREAARRAIVMLRNEGGLLPLAPRGLRIALIGPMAQGPGNLYGPWSLFPGTTPPIDIAQGLRTALGGRGRLRVVRGCGIDRPLPGGVREAVAAARDADVVLLAIGESDTMSGEARSRTSVTLPAAQQALADAVIATGRPTVVLLKNGRALALEGGLTRARSVLVTWFLGTMTGAAIADLVFGLAEPTGRLPVSFPRTPGQVPLYHARRRSGRPWSAADPHADFKARYLDAAPDPLYPFGHGLGYSQVRYESLTLSTQRLPWGQSIEARVRVANVGARDTTEVVQLYLTDKVASVARPERELKAFRRIALRAGEQVEVTLGLAPDDLAFIGVDLQPVIEPGEFVVHAGPSAAGGPQATFTLLPR